MSSVSLQITNASINQYVRCFSLVGQRDNFKRLHLQWQVSNMVPRTGRPRVITDYEAT